MVSLKSFLKEETPAMARFYATPYIVIITYVNTAARLREGIGGVREPPSPTYV